jgi:hypothetical protein
VSYDTTGATASPGAGYSWIVEILPEIEEQALFQNISINSNKFSLPAFSPVVINGAPGGGAPHASTLQLERFRCPSCAGGPVVDVSPRMIGVAGGAIETGSAISNYVGGIATASGSTGIAITNYNAILGTHVDPHSKSASNPNNGAMRFRPIDGRAFDIGMKLASITDGLSRTPTVAETRERRFSSWYDGTMNWVVAARHSSPDAGTTPIRPVCTQRDLGPQIQGSPISMDRLAIGTDGTPSTGGTALNYGPTAEHPAAV